MVVPYVIAAVLCAPVAPATPATPGDELAAQAYFGSIPRSLELLGGERFDFRYRRLDFDVDAPGEIPTRVAEGVQRIEYRGLGVLTLNLYLEDQTDDARFGDVFRERTLYAFTSGEYVRATRLAGASADRVMIARWNGLPHVTYLALGLLGPEAALDGAEFRGLQERPDGTRELVYVLEDGKTLKLYDEPTPPGKLLRAESRASDDAWQEVIYFEDHIEGVGGLPARPTRIVNARVRRDGKLSELSVWQAIESLGEAAIDDRVSAGAVVANLRAPGEQGVERETDRPMTLEALLDAPHGILAPQEFGAIVLEADALDPRPIPVEDDVDPRLAGMIAAVGVMGVALGMRRRRLA